MRKTEYTHPWPASVFKRRTAQALPKGLVLMVRVRHYPDDDPEHGYIPARADRPKVAGRSKLLELAVRGYLDQGRQSDHLPATVAGVLDYVQAGLTGSGEWSVADIQTVEKFREAEEAAERSACEAVAAEVCSRYRVRPGTTAFVRAAVGHYAAVVEVERDYRENPELQAERYACYWDKDNYWRDNDYSREVEGEARRQIDRLIRYLEKHQPLLMGLYREEERRRGCDDE